MEDEILSLEEFRQLVLDDEYFPAHLAMLTSGWIPYEHVILAGNTYTSAQSMKKVVPDAGGPHQELTASVEAAIAAAELAFETAVKAAYELAMAARTCNCSSCRIRHQRANADQQ